MAKASFKKLKNMMPNQAKVLIIRHGSTDLNKEGGTSQDRIRGWADVLLNDKGRADAEKAAKKLEHEHPEEIYASDLKRAEETAHIINQHFHVPMTISRDLRPWNVGMYTGKKTDEVIGDLNHCVKNEEIVPVDGESFKHFRTRYLSKLREIMDEALRENCTYFVVSHFRNVKTYAAWEKLGFPEDLSIDPETMIEDNCKPGEIITVDLDTYVKRDMK